MMSHHIRLNFNNQTLLNRLRCPRVWFRIGVWWNSSIRSILKRLRRQETGTPFGETPSGSTSVFLASMLSTFICK